MGSKAKTLDILKNNGFNVPNLIICDKNMETESELFKFVYETFSEEDVFAVRSSASNEDSGSSSMAGYYYSALGVTKNNLFEEYQNVVKSYKGLDGKVIVQQFIPSDKAGIIFTDRGDGKSVINTSLGLCKPVVEGKACDEIILSKIGKVAKKHIAEEKECLYFEAGKFIEKTNFNEPTLTDSDIEKVHSFAKKIEKFLGSPQDIEWCIKNDDLYILQSRPITRKLVEKKATEMYDSANIAESYSGIISPLTISFAARIYKIVYQNLLIASGASRNKIDKHKDIFDNMVVSFYGRLYYNIKNWYLMMSFMPGYQRNKENLEDMITSNVREDIMRSVLPSFSLKLAYPFIVIGKMIIFDKTRLKFIAKVKNALKFFRDSNLGKWDYIRCVDEYQKLSENLLEKWHITVENDFLMMTYLGILKKKYSEDELKDMIQFGNISSKQVDMLKSLSDKMFEISEIKSSIETKDVESFDENIAKYPNLKTELDNYFEIYGGRFANELKLESTDISENKGKMLSVLQFYNKMIVSKQLKKQNSKKESFTLRKFKKYASQREEMRLLRSNTFGIVRKLFNRMGDILQNEKIINDKSDIYFLHLEEILEDLETIKAKNYNATIEKRKKDYKEFEKVVPEPWFEIAENDEIPLASFANENQSSIVARACTLGIAEGKARVFKEFYLPEDTDFDILVAKNTDPGWTPLIGLAKGLIIEHGGILSHAAIVSRELGIPTVIGAKNATDIIKDNQIVKINGKTGLVELK